jgi:hypothetical protein
MSDEIQEVWLIEANGSYWDGRSTDAGAFSRNANDAVRFSRFEDAEKVKYWLLGDYAFALKTTQHVWFKDAAQKALLG